MKRHLFSALSLLMASGMASATTVSVVMNNTSTTMTLADKESGTSVNVGSPSGKTYTFEAIPGSYILTAYSGSTVNGTIQLDVNDMTSQSFTVLTCTAYATNSGWKADTDYTLEVVVNSREGETIHQTPGNSTTTGRKTFLALNGNSYYASLIPSDTHYSEGFRTFFKAGTLTANSTVSGKVTKGTMYTIATPIDADIELGMKRAHFTEYIPVKPVETTLKDGCREYTYELTYEQIYNYRTWKTGGLTQAGYFKLSETAENPVINFNEESYQAYDPKQINHSVKSNEGYETGDILVNINPQNYLRLNMGETFKAHAMRMWEVTDNSTNNYMMEPDYHYSVINLDGTPSEGVLEITTSPTSAWADIKAVGEGSVIVLVTYDGIRANYYKDAEIYPYMGGEFWGAIWPENTAAYVVTVGQAEANLKPNMFINEEYNSGAMKMAGDSVDSEHDVLYYLDNEDGAYYTFKPEGTSKIEIAHPVIGERMATYNGFSSDNVTLNADGSYTIKLTHGRNIVRLVDNSGNATYQIMRAKPCSRVISNISRPGSTIFQPGDQVKIQYSGLFHPANKLAGIYNMSAYVTYNGVPNGSSLILGSGQYTFGSAPSAQAVTVTIPADHDVNANPTIVMDNGVIQVNGYGDPIGNHRTISPTAGRSPNFTAVAHKTYFGKIPNIEIALTAVKNFTILTACNVADAVITVSRDGKTLTPQEDGTYYDTFGTYTVNASKTGYRNFTGVFSINDDAEGIQTFSIEMVALGETDWDGSSRKQPLSDAEGVYLIGTGAELAWFANEVNTSKNYTISGRLTADIDLGGFSWTPIGGSSSSTAFQGKFYGDGHTVSSLVIKSTANYNGFFGYVNNAVISGLTVSGKVEGKQYNGGIAAYANGTTKFDRCVNLATVTSTSTYAGGIVSYLNNKEAAITNCYNLGDITATGYCAGIVGRKLASTPVENVFNLGTIDGGTAATVGACVGGSGAIDNIKNAFCIQQYAITTGQTLVTDAQMQSGEVAYHLGDAFGQEIGTDKYPLLDGEKVKYSEEYDLYYNGDNVNVSVDEIETEVEITGYYNATGIFSNTPQSGLNIVVYTNGTVKKIYVR